jgi:hypothetical protein
MRFRIDALRLEKNEISQSAVRSCCGKIKEKICSLFLLQTIYFESQMHIMFKAVTHHQLYKDAFVKS